MEKVDDNGGLLADSDHKRCSAFVLQQLYAIFAFSSHLGALAPKASTKLEREIDEMKSNSIHRPPLFLSRKIAIFSWFLSCGI